MHAYFMDDIPGDQRLPHDSGRAASDDALKSIGVSYWHIPIDETATYRDEVVRIAKERDYKNHDVIVINKESLGDEFETKIKNFYHEHMHEDEEIGYILEGVGYLDVRACHRVMDSVPASTYHRFTLDMTNHSQIMRLFKDEPRLVAHIHGHETDLNPIRIQYMRSIDIEVQ